MPCTQTNQELLPGYYVYINTLKRFYKVGLVEPFQYDTGEESTAIFSSIAANTTGSFVNVSQLEPDDKPDQHLFQVMSGVRYAKMQYAFKVPQGTDRFGTDVTKTIGFIDGNLSPFHNPNKDFQFWCAKNFFPQVRGKNTAGVPLTPKIRFTGFKYEIFEVKDEGMLRDLRSSAKQYKTVVIGGTGQGQTFPEGVKC